MRLVIFDVDGTLVDSQNTIVEAQARAFAANGLPAPKRAQSLSVIGLSLAEAFLALAGPAGPIESLGKSYVEAWTEIRQRPGYSDLLYPGVTDLIAALAADPETMLGLATGKSRRGVDRILATQGWSDVFATIQTADAHPSKPDPSMILAALQETGVTGDETIMVGDTTYDMAMGVSAGVVPIGVAWGYHARADLIASGAAAIAENVGDLRMILANLAKEPA